MALRFVLSMLPLLPTSQLLCRRQNGWQKLAQGVSR